MPLTHGHRYERVCWTRMQTESGEGLTRIVMRKEMERRAGNGLFFWGIGNAPSRAIPSLVGAATEIDVLFSVMKSRPKASDVIPSRVLAWRQYVDSRGNVRPIPAHVLVTSRRSSRNYHYALVCRSEVPLRVADEGPFDPAAFRNFGAGGAVGASQVTALLERCGSDGPSSYRVAMRARLSEGLWVKLVDPVELSRTAQAAMVGGPAYDDWFDFVDRIRTCGGLPPARNVPQPSLFAI